METAGAFIRYAIQIGALKFAPDGFRLKSGRISPYFFNSAVFNTGQTKEKLADWYAALAMRFVKKESPTENGKRFILFGPAYKGIELASSASVALWELYKVEVGCTYNRKEEKDHGEGGTLVGHPLRGHPVIVVDDVMTTGGSSGKAVETIRLHEGLPRGCIIAFDREERGAESAFSAVQEFEYQHKVPVVSLATLTDFVTLLQSGEVPLAQEVIDCYLPRLLEYRDRYGTN